VKSVCEEEIRMDETWRRRRKRKGSEMKKRRTEESCSKYKR